MGIRWSVPLVIVVSVLTLTGVAAAARETIDVKVKPRAELLEDGAVRVGVRMRCDAFGDPFESNITVTQDRGFLAAQVGLPVAPCDGRWHTVSVVVKPLDGGFHTGPAFASAFVSRIDPDRQEVRQGQDVRDIRVR